MPSWITISQNLPIKSLHEIYPEGTLENTGFKISYLFDLCRLNGLSAHEVWTQE